ncbi:MAG: hypothetical protein CVV10_07860, partial [Gammaproteobacteria bacterium HGW-Gammaproteobacteria-14]
MSALGGIVHFDAEKPVDRATAERLLSVITQYGKDAQNSWERRGALLMRSLLRTTPEDRLDRQPVVSPESGRVTIFDGRLDNREELAATLEVDTARLRLMADSELVAHAFDAWQEQAFKRLVGDFALANWDQRSRWLLIGRDAVGYRPVYWHQSDGRFVFGSLPKFLFTIQGVPRELREESLHDYLCSIPLEPRATLFKSIYRVEPGEFLSIQAGKTSFHRYHSFEESAPLQLKDPMEYVDGLEEKLTMAVSCRLRSAGPVASELISGLDSSTVTAIAAKLLGASDRRLIALTGVLPENKREGAVRKGWHRDEAPGATALARMYENIDHILVESCGKSPLEGLRGRIESMDSPVYNPCNAGWVSDVQRAATNQGARVLLNGWQGNLTISHDGRSLLQSLLIRGRLISWWRILRAMRRRFPGLSRQWFLEFSIAPHVPSRLWAAYQSRKGKGLNLSSYSAVSPELQKRLNTDRRARRVGHDLMFRGNSNSIRLRLGPLLKTEFAGTCLSMNARDLEPRSPTMDQRLIEYCFSIPEKIYLHEGCPQWPIRKLGESILPPEIVGTRTRGYQAADWFEAVTAAREDLR